MAERYITFYYLQLIFFSQSLACYGAHHLDRTKMTLIPQLTPESPEENLLIMINAWAHYASK